MSTVARVLSLNFAQDGINVVIARRGGEVNNVVVGINEQGITFKTVEANIEPPVLIIPDDIARALLDALATHYGGTSDSRTLRQDYEKERARVDRLLDKLIIP